MTTPLHRIDDRTLVAGQIALDEMEALKAQGVTLLVCNRPDGESPDQPSAAETRAAAAAAGLDFVWAPVSGFPDPAAVAGTGSALEALAPEGKALLYCKSGGRSVATWGLARRAEGDDADSIRDRASGAGYDLSRLPL